MRVLEILNAYPGETFIQEHARAILEYNPEIELIWAFTMTDKEGIIAAPFLNGPKTYAFYNANRSSRFDRIWKRILNFGKTIQQIQRQRASNLIKRINPDLIHFHFASTAVQWKWIKAELNIPFSFSLRGSDINVLPITRSSYMDDLQAVINEAKAIHSVSFELISKLKSKLQTDSIHTQVIRTCIDQSWEEIERKPQLNNLLSIGRLHWIKAIPDLILAIADLKKKGLLIRLRIIGDGPDYDKIKYMISDFKLENEIYLLGYLSKDEIKKEMEQTHFIISTSLFEGFPNVLAEAMMAGVPIITSDCPGITELLNNPESAVFVKSGEPHDISSGIEKAIFINKKQLKERNDSNKLLAQKHFTHHKHSNSFKDFYDWIMN